MVVRARHERSAEVGHVGVVAIKLESVAARCRIGGRKLERGARARCGRMAMIANQRGGGSQSREGSADCNSRSTRE